MIFFPAAWVDELCANVIWTNRNGEVKSFELDKSQEKINISTVAVDAGSFARWL